MMIARKRKLAGMENTSVMPEGTEKKEVTREFKDNSPWPDTASGILQTRVSVTFEEIIKGFMPSLNNDRNSRLVEISLIGVYLSDPVLLRLIRAGFHYRKHIGPIGETIHVISLV